MADAEPDQLAINTICTLSIDVVQAANSGHPGAPLALAPLAYTRRAIAMPTLVAMPCPSGAVVVSTPDTK